ncbi:MAG: aminotransferase class V-fold PLP-dependent enzyme [Prosthecobacter sp.]|uniref:cysteine desulfurase family protein n=1 Tax=Prosthecobacter sp. TaxID=1965333 RepID=UPI0025E3786F|nr:aminotransferase class V-fold PLP-dependent enzyme [Prosthecobacter sp.]MCF7784755.1 aminotransferase class V-fold PLP-dependent enzyme [Prosthecobacter sp.]
MIYLDANATTPVDPAVLEAMLPFLREHYANPSASYAGARRVRRAIEQARTQVAALLGASPAEITFTSGGTESINAVHASVRALWPEKPELIIASTEHAAVLESARRWQAQGGKVTTVPVHPDGRVDLQALHALVRPGATALVSIMWANNETGVIAPMHEIVSMAHAAGALVHTDAVQAAGKIHIDVRTTPVDFLSLSGHKMHAPKGVGALYVSQRARFAPLLVGGGQENERRGGTENVPGIIALGKAAELAIEHLSDGNKARIKALRDRFEHLIHAALPEMRIHGCPTHRLHTTSSFCLPEMDAAGMLILLDQAGIACSAGSACHTGALHASHVLEAMGASARDAACTLRCSFNRFNTKAEAETAAHAVIECSHKMREAQGYELSVISH